MLLLRSLETSECSGPPSPQNDPLGLEGISLLMVGFRLQCSTNGFVLFLWFANDMPQGMVADSFFIFLPNFLTKMFKLVKRQHIYRYNRTVEERLVKIYVPHVILKYTHIYFKDTLNSYTCDSENILLYFPMA